METLIVIIIIALAVVFALWRLRKAAGGDCSSCSCGPDRHQGCAGCPQPDPNPDPPPSASPPDTERD